MILCVSFFFFFKQKTAYEMRISDWSSDVCSSDLERVHDIANYIRKGKLWEAFTAPAPPVLLIDEIDKADIEFPNHLLQELDRMEFQVYETRETVRAVERPIVPITPTNDKERKSTRQN